VDHRANLWATCDSTNKLARTFDRRSRSLAHDDGLVLGEGAKGVLVEVEVGVRDAGGEVPWVTYADVLDEVA